MFRNYLTSAVRSLSRQKLIAFINITGLSVGIGCFALFTLYAVNELNYDNFHRNARDIYRVYLWHEAKGQEPARADTYQPMPLGPAMKKDLPGVLKYVRFREGVTGSFVKAGDNITREKLAFADPDFFSVFSFQIRSGARAPLKDLHSLVLTESTAKAFFAKTDPLGKTILIKTDTVFVPFTITAIVADLPTNSSIRFNMLANFNYLATTGSGARRVNNWHQYAYQTYVLLKPGSHLPAEKNALIAFRRKYYLDEEANSRKDGWLGKGPRNWLGLQPLTVVHTDTRILGGSTAAVDPETIWILLSIAFGILIIACINFTTLAIGRSAGRAKEVGIRKVIGGSRTSLIRQFLTEAGLLTAVAALFSFILARVMLPYFNALSGKELHFSLTQFPQLIGLLAAILIVTGFLAGSYPAFVLSGFNPVRVLKSQLKLSGSNLFTRTLVTFQFVLSAALIISTVIVLQQLHFMRSKNPGFDKANVVVVDAGGISNTRRLYDKFKAGLSSHPEILRTASAEVSLGGNQGWSQSMFKYNGSDKSVYEYFVDPGYLSTMGLTLLAGRNFDPRIASDSVTAVVINEEMMKNFGWTLQTAVGQRLKGYYDDPDDPRTPLVIGVVKNFNFLSFGAPLRPQMFQEFSAYQPYKFLVRIQPGEPTKALAVIDAVWKDIAPEYPLQYSFLDEDLDLFYTSEARWGNIVASAGTISVFLACLGLFGLAALSAINRIKEIGIRKVLGASFGAILVLLSKDLLKLVLLAFLIATPLAWYVMREWLNGYANRVPIEAGVFAATGGLTLLIALVVIFSQSVRTAGTSPVKSLRSE